MPTNFDNFRLPRNLQFVARTNLAVPMATGVASDIFHLEVVSMRPDEAVVDRGGEDSDDLRVPHLMALLHDLVRGHGRLEAARRLELDPRTVGKCMDGGRMTWRVREALERARRKGLLCGCSEESGGDGDPLEQRVDALEQGIRAEVENVRREMSAIDTGHSRTIRQIERRLDRMEIPGNSSDTEAGPIPSEKPATGAPRRDWSSGGHVRGLPPTAGGGRRSSAKEGTLTW